MTSWPSSKLSFYFQNQQFRGVLRKRCSKDMKQIYRRGPMPVCDSIKLQSNFIEITLWHGCSPVTYLHIFRTPKNTPDRLLLIFCCIRLRWYFYAQVIFTFHVYLSPVTNKRFIRVIKDDIYTLFGIRMPQILILKPRSMNLYIKVNTHAYQDLQVSFQFSRYPKLNFS